MAYKNVIGRIEEIRLLEKFLNSHKSVTMFALANAIGA